MTSVAGASPMRYLDKALTTVRSLGMPSPQDAVAPAVQLLEVLAPIDQPRVAAIARVLQCASGFNALVREQTAGVGISDRFRVIVSSFDSLIADGKRQIAILDDGQVTWKERLWSLWMRLRRGDINHRFDLIRKTYLEVSNDAGSQLQRSKAVLEFYLDFRGSQKEGAILAAEIVAMLGERVSACVQDVESAAAAIANVPADDAAGRGRAELARDEAIRRLEDEKHRLQIAKDLAEELNIAYHTSEAVMARLRQTLEVHTRVHSKGAMFFGTNEVTLTSVSATIASQASLAESIGAIEALEDGTNKAIDFVADHGNALLKRGVRAGYGPTVKAESVRKLVDAVVNFTTDIGRDIEEMQALSAQNSREIGEAVESGKRRYQNLMVAAATRRPALPAAA